MTRLTSSGGNRLSTGRGVISQLRDVIPIRPLLRAEALRIAELQAQRFLVMTNVHAPAVPERVIAELPHIQVSRVSPLPVSGASHWSNGQWLVALRASEPLTRQRFSLAHELKHIIDHRFADIIFGAIPATDRHLAVEQVCDYFAACLLMPRPWVKRAWCAGMQTLPTLAQHFGVSEAAMQVRLTQIGLIEPAPRCDNTTTDWFVRTIKPKSDSVRYHRELTRRPHGAQRSLEHSGAPA